MAVVKFYNPGSRKEQKLKFDNPVADPKYQNAVSYFDLEAPQESFFEVPTVVEFLTENGRVEVPVRFAERIQNDFRQYGIVRIDPDRQDILPEENWANTAKEAREKGTRFWNEYLEAVAREHIQTVEQAYALGGIPSRARGDAAHALKVLGIEDPADKVGTAINRVQDNDKISKLEKQVEDLMALVTAKSGK